MQAASLTCAEKRSKAISRAALHQHEVGESQGEVADRGVGQRLDEAGVEAERQQSLGFSRRSRAEADDADATVRQFPLSQHLGDPGAAGAHAHVRHPDIEAAALALKDAADARTAEGEQDGIAPERQNDDFIEEVVDQIGLQPLATLEASDDDRVEALRLHERAQAGIAPVALGEGELPGRPPARVRRGSFQGRVQRLELHGDLDMRTYVDHLGDLADGCPRAADLCRISGQAPGARYDRGVALPLFGRPPLQEGRHLARPQAPDCDHADVGAAQPLALAVGDQALADLRHVVLQTHQVDLRFVNIAHRGTAFEHVTRQRLVRDLDLCVPRLTARMQPCCRLTLCGDTMHAELHVVRIVDRHPPEHRLLPADFRIGRQGGQIEDVRHAELLHAPLAVGPREAIGHAPVRFLRVERAAEPDALENRDIVAVYEADMAHVERVLEIFSGSSCTRGCRS